MDHGGHSRLVRFWKPAGAESLHLHDWDLNTEQMHTLVSPFAGFRVAVSFSVVPSVPDKVLVRSTNWRAEHEPRVWVPVEEARAFWRQLIRAGFVEEVRP